MSTFESLNRRISQQQFIKAPADARYFHDLIGLIRGMAQRNKRDVERFLPDVAEAGAWTKAYDIYEAFVRLEKEPTPDPVATQRTLAAAATENVWNAYLRNRDMVIEYCRRRELSPQQLEYIGVKDGDLGPPIDNTDLGAPYGGRRSNWRDVASRLNRALSQWERMEPGEKAAIPQVMAARRIEAGNREMAKLATRLSALEAVQEATLG